MIYYIKGVRERLKEYEDYLVHPQEGQERYQTSYERAFEKVNNIIDFIKEELSKPNPILYRCPYTNFRGGNLNRKMLKYNDPQTPQTKWCISVAKNGEDWVVFGIEQDKALASRDIRENTKMLSLQQYINENGIKWTKEKCEEEARKYKSRGKFAKGNSGAYNAALKNGWIDDYDWFRDERFDFYKDPIDMVYAYFFHDLNAVYVGRTLMRLQQDRDKAHIFNEKDSVVRFAKENNVPSPPMVTLEKDLTLEQGAKQEGYWVEHFKNEGWNILNRKKAGGIGGIGHGKWNKKSCEREAKKYQSRGEFQKGSFVAYNVSRKNGWLDDYDWFVLGKKINGYWNKETCAEEASKYKFRYEFSKGCASAYIVALKNGWLDDYDWFEQKHHDKWTKETCAEEAKKYKTRGEFQKGSGGAYNIACKNDWIDDYDWLEVKQQNIYKWTKKTCAKEASKYKTSKEFKKGKIGAYLYAREHDLLKEFFPKKSITEYLYSRISIIQN